jgi:citrate lyase subunit beta/citryl-CoA lyase
MSGPLRLRRSFCYVPPAYPAVLEASRQIKADVLCLDLEDSTPAAVKAGARALLTEYLAAGKPRAREVLVRVNGLDTEWGFEDLRFAARLGVDGVLLPKVEGDGMVRQALKILADTIEAPPALWCLVETPLGILRAEQIAACPVEGLVVGGADLAEGLGARHTPARTPLLHVLSQVVLAARAYGRTAIDAVHLDFGDLAGLEAAAQQGVELGFHGKSVFTAEAVAIANRIFAPSEQEVTQARAALSGAGGYGGHLDHARRVIALHELATAES